MSDFIDRFVPPLHLLEEVVTDGTLWEPLLPDHQGDLRKRCKHPEAPASFISIDELQSTMIDRFERQVTLNPDSPAVLVGELTITYRQLDQMANRLAHDIVARQADNSPLILLFKPGPSQVLAMVAAMKSGCSILCCDPQLPIGRLKYFQRTIGSHLTLVSEEYLVIARNLHIQSDRSMVVDWFEQKQLSRDPPERQTTSPDCCYYLFTSGSTGRPKGMAVSHRAVINDLAIRINLYGVSAEDRILLTASSTGSSISQVFTALASGACIVNYDVSQRGIQNIVADLKQFEVTIAMFSVTLFRQVLPQFEDQRDLSHLRLIRIGSSSIYKSDIEGFQTLVPSHCLLVATYNSSETRSISTFFVDQSTRIPENRCPSGYIVTGKSVYLLGDDGCPVKPGETGRIHVVGRYLINQYLDEQELSRRSFFTDENGLVHFRSSDFGYFNEDNCLVHCGRVGKFVQIRGYSVDLNELEVSLCNLAEVRDAVVVEDETPEGESRLSAFVSLKHNCSLTVSDIRSILRERLPSYMVPQSIHLVTEIPIAPGGKVDFKMLQTLKLVDESDSRPVDRAVTPVQKTLMQIWLEELDQSQIGIHDSFLDLGGHSLQAMNILAKIERQLGFSIPPGILLTAPTIALMSEQIENLKATHA